MASSAGSHGITSNASDVKGGNGDSGNDSDGSGKGGPGGPGRGGKGVVRGSAPTSVHVLFGGKGKGKMVQFRAVGPGTCASHSLSLPNPATLVLASHANIGTDGTFEVADMSAQFEFTDTIGNPLGASAAMSFDTESTQTSPSWLDSVKAESVVWRD
jgi:hypothetical protein